MKYLIKMFFLVLTFNVFGQTINETPKQNTKNINSLEVPVEFCTGVPDIGIELFNVQTIDPNFNLNFNLKYDLYANTSIRFSTKQIGDAWSLPVLPMITRSSNGILSGSEDTPITDEMYYEDTANTESRNNPDKFVYNIFGLSGKFYFVRENNQIKIIIIEQNDYAKIEFSHTPILVAADGNLKYKLKSFTITDKNGYKYFFNLHDSYDIMKKDTNDLPILYPEHFYLTSIVNSSNSVLCEYIYADSGLFRTVSIPSKFYYKNEIKIKHIDIKHIGKVELSLDSAQKNNITLKDTRDQLLKKIELLYTNYSYKTTNGNSFTNLTFSKNLLHTINIFSKDLLKKQTYTIRYNTDKTLKNSFVNESGFLIREDKCNNISSANKEYLYYDYAVLKRINNPTGGFTIYEFEPNDFFIKGISNSTNLDEGNINYFREKNSENFFFEDIPLTHDPINNRYTGNPYSILNADYTKVFINYDALYYYPNPLNPNTLVYPTLKVKKHSLLNFTNGLLLQNIRKQNEDCPNGYQFEFWNSKFSLEYEPGRHNLYNSITAKILKYKPDNELEKYIYGHGLRIKKIKFYDKQDPNEEWNQGTITISPNKEIVYNYRFFNDSKASSGFSKNEPGLISGGMSDVTDLIYYENVSVETKGLGKMEYTFLSPNNEASYFERKLPKKIVKKDETGNIVEENIFTRNFKEFNPSATGEFKQPIITYEKVINRNYVNGNSTPLELITESRFDTISRNLTSKKIINSLLGETFEEQYTYVNHNNSYLPKTVNKFKNGIALNHSENFYSLKKCLVGFISKSFYNLTNSQIAKADLPLEIENEYTSYSCEGKLLEYKTKDGMYVSQIWGYNGAFVIAELHNIKYSEINSQKLQSLITAANKTDSTYNENTIRGLVNDLRTAHPNAKIKSYTFNPLVGMTSMTDVNGRNEFYEYDNFNRLFRIKDHNGLILKEYNYNYIPPTI